VLCLLALCAGAVPALAQARPLATAGRGSSARPPDLGGAARAPEVDAALPPPRGNAEDDTLEQAKASYQSPRRFLFELRFGSYTPAIDSEFNGATPYDSIFHGAGLLFGGELEVELFQRFGTLSVGGRLGYFTKSAPALLKEDPTKTSATETSISILPMAILAIYRFDYLAQRWRVPLIPYAKFGFNYNVWWITKAGSDTVKGGTFGWEFHAGGAFLLDVLEPNAAKTLDVELGINHTYLFFEYSLYRADNFGSSTALHVGDSTWTAGLALEF